MRGAVFDALDHDLFELGRGVDVDLPLQHDDGYLTADAYQLDTELWPVVHPLPFSPQVNVPPCNSARSTGLPPGRRPVVSRR